MESEAETVEESDVASTDTYSAASPVLDTSDDDEPSLDSSDYNSTLSTHDETVDSTDNGDDLSDKKEQKDHPFGPNRDIMGNFIGGGGDASSVGPINQSIDAVSTGVEFDAPGSAMEEYTIETRRRPRRHIQIILRREADRFRPYLAKGILKYLWILHIIFILQDFPVFITSIFPFFSHFLFFSVSSLLIFREKF